MELRGWLTFAATALCVFSSAQEIAVEPPSTTAVPVPKANSDIAYNVNKFGYRLLLKMMNENKNENIIISPTGIAGLLAMTLLGSVGKTYDEIAETLGFEQDIYANRKNHKQLGRLLQSLNGNVTSKTLYADAMFVGLHTPLREVYRNYLLDVYRSDILSTDFKATDDTKTLINEWVRNHTEGQIENFLKHSLPSSTKLVLLSAFYFSGQWKRPFLPEYTSKMAFQIPSGEIKTDLMLNLGDFRYTVSRKHDFIMIALPYNDSETTMYAFMPLLPSKQNLLDVMAQIDYENIDNAINQMTTSDCVVRFPKMELKSNVNLEDSLKVLGIHKMFTPGEANFALMLNGNGIINKTEEEIITKINSTEGDHKEGPTNLKDALNRLPNPGIHVDSVMHDVKISINEFGTEAVAATSAILARSANLFYANSPFYFFIRNDRTKLVTFSAVIYDPRI